MANSNAKAPAVKVEGEKNEKANIRLLEHAEFEGDMKTNIISSIDMAEIVGSLFAPAFSDYYGCNVRVNDGRANPIIANSMPIGAIYVDLFFKDRGDVKDGKWKNLELRNKIANDAESGKPSLGDRFHRLNGQLNNGRAYNVTKETYEALDKFTFNPGRTRWAEHTQEITSPMSIYGKDEIVVCISGLSLNKIITEIYGGEDENDNKYEYMATPSTIIPSTTQEFIMQVCQLDLKAVRDLQRTLGVYAGNPTQFHQYNR